MPLVTGSHLRGVHSPEEYMNFIVWDDGFNEIFRVQRSAWSDGGYTLLRQFADAGGISIVFYVKVDSVFTRENLDIVSCPLVSGSYLFGVHTSFHSSTQWMQFLRQYGGLGKICTNFCVKVVLGSRGRFWRDTQLGSSVDTLTRRSTEKLASCASVRVFEAF